MRGFQEVKKMNQALLRLLNLDICSVLSNFQGLFNEDNQDALPYRQSLEYVLVKLLGACKLLVRTVICAKKAILYFFGFTKAGSFFIKGAILLGTLSKIWNDSRSICENLCKFYGKLLGCREFLKNGKEFLPASFEFPENLMNWLGKEWQEKVKESSEPIQLAEEIKEEQEEESSILTIKPDYLAKTIKSELELEDFTPLSRDEELTSIVELKQPKHSLKKVKTIEAFQKFIKNENNYRKLDQNKSLTIKKFNNKKWKLINVDLQRKIVLMQEKPFLVYFKDLCAQ